MTVATKDEFLIKGLQEDHCSSQQHPVSPQHVRGDRLTRSVLVLYPVNPPPILLFHLEDGTLGMHDTLCT